MDIDTLCESTKLRLIANALGLQQCTKTAANIVPIPGKGQIIVIGTKADVARLLELEPAAATTQASTAQAEPAITMGEYLNSDSPAAQAARRGTVEYLQGYAAGKEAALRAAQGATTSSTDAQAAPTDLSKRLRAAATAEVSYADARLLIGAAEEIERYYGGMMAWKRTAEAKDAAHADHDPIDELVDVIDVTPQPGHGADLPDSEGGHHD